MVRIKTKEWRERGRRVFDSLGASEWVANTTSTTARTSSGNPRPRAQFFPTRTSRLVNNVYLFRVITFAKCVLTILKLNWNQRFRDKRTKLNICHQMLTSSTQLQNRSFHVVERTRTSAKRPKMTNAPAKRAKLLFFIVIVTLLFPLSSWCNKSARTSYLTMHVRLLSSLNRTTWKSHSIKI